LSAVGSSSSCVKAPSARLTTSIETMPAGLGLRSGKIQPGTYNLSHMVPPGTAFVGWECLDVSSTPPGNLTVGAGPSVILNGGVDVKCVARYTLLVRRRQRLHSLLSLGN
jgi:hypothetical protein